MQRGASVVVWAVCLMLTTRLYIGTASTTDDIVTADNQFAQHLYTQIAKTSSPQDNIFFSPTSIAILLDFVYNGARQTTASQMANVLGLQSSDGKSLKNAVINGANKNLLTMLADSNVLINNGLFTRSNITLKKRFISTGKEYYGAKMRNMDFGKEPSESCKQINNWVAKRTKQKITDLLPPSCIDPSTILVLVNTIYFKADWEMPFIAAATTTAPFHIDQNHTVDITMMFVSGMFRQGPLDSLNCTVLELPYKNNNMTMIIMLPDKDSTQVLTSAADFSDVLNRTAKMPANRIDVTIPKFKLSNQLQLKDPLVQMGMKDLFSVKDAKLTGITGTPLYVSSAVHQAWINVDETGTEAGAGTDIAVSSKSMTASVPFIADRPFVFLIANKLNGIVLFAGRFASPQQ